MAHTLFVLLDGMEDDPNPALGGRKPYEVAKMPFMRSKCPYLHHTTGRGYTQLFLNEFWTGYPPETPRAALEAAGLSMDVSGTRQAFRLSPARIEDGKVVWAYGNYDADSLVETMKRNMGMLAHRNPEIKFFVHGRSVLTMECAEEVPAGPQAPIDGPYVNPLDDLERFIMKVSKENNGLTVYPWGVGRPSGIHPCFPCVKDLVAVSNSPTALGVAATLGHRIIFVENLEDRFPVARKELQDHDVFLHLDEVDEYSHEKDHMKKIATLEKIDTLMEEYFSDAERMLLFVDHGTSCVTGTHILMEVPFRTNIDSFGDGDRVVLAEIVPTAMEKIQ